MYMRVKTLCAAAALFAVGTFAAGAATVTATAYAGEPGYSTDLGAGESWYPTYEPSVVSGSVSSQYASPFGDDSDYYTVGSPNLAVSPAVLDLGTMSDEFSLLWGTVDSYNAIGLYSDPYTLVDFVTGDEILALLGVGAGGTGAIVDIVSAFEFQYVGFFSNYGTEGDQDIAAFEFALKTPAPVPVPAAGLLLLGGLGALGAAKRRRKSA